MRRAFGREVVELRNDCWGCDLQGPCITWLEPAPGGGTIHVAPSHYEPTCTDGICDGSCHELVRHCEIPELPEGDGVFDVVVDGVVRATLGRGAEAMRTTPCTGG